MDDTIADAYATHSINILRVASGMRAKAHDALLDLEGHLVGKVATATSPNAQARLAALLKQTQGTIAKTYETIAENQGRDLAEIARVEAKTAKRIMGKAIGADILSVGTTPNQLAAVADHETVLGHSSKAWWKQQSDALQHDFTGTMRQGILSGETNDQLIRRVRGTAANAYNDGIMSKPRREAAAIVRSSAISTSNAARLETLKEMDDVVKGIQWLSTLDGRTTKICMALDGLAWRLPDFEPIGHDKKYPGPTAHWNCRSTQIPVMRSWEEISGKKLPSVSDEEIEARMKKKLAAQGMSKEQIAKATVDTRASMDGQVSNKMDFEKWLQTKPDNEIDNILGPGRAKLWDRGRGKVAIADLTNQDNRPLTIKQLVDLAENGTPPPETLGVSYFTMDPAGRYQPSVKPPNEAAKVRAAEAKAAAATKRAEEAEARSARIIKEARLKAGLPATDKPAPAIPGTLPKGAKQVKIKTKSNVLQVDDPAAFAQAMQTQWDTTSRKTAPYAWVSPDSHPDVIAMLKAKRSRFYKSVGAYNIKGETMDAFGLDSTVKLDAIGNTLGTPAPAAVINPPAPPRPAATAPKDPGKSHMAWRMAHEEVSDTQSALPYLGTPDEAPAVLQVWGTGGFTEINAPTTIADHAVGDALVKTVAALPDSKIGTAHRVLGFPDPEAQQAFIASLGKPGETYRQDRKITAWSIEDPTRPGATPNNTIGLDLASQFGDYNVILTTRGSTGLKDISFIYGPDSTPGTELVMAQGAGLRVVSTKRVGDAIHVELEPATLDPASTAALQAELATAKKAAPKRKKLDEKFEPGIEVEDQWKSTKPLTRLGEMVPDLRPGDIRALSSGRPGEQISIRPANAVGQKGVSFSIEAPGVKAFRTLYKDKAGQLHIKNWHLFLDETGTGRGFETFYQQVQTAKALGVSTIRTEAARAPGAGPFNALNGYYTWPRLGYDGDLKIEFAEQASKALGRPVKRVLDLYGDEAGRAYWKANGYSIHLEFDLAEGSRSQKVLEAYAKAKGR